MKEKWIKINDRFEMCNTKNNMTYDDAVKSLKKGERLPEDFECCEAFRKYEELEIIRYKDYWNKSINGVARVSWLNYFSSNSNFIAEVRSVDNNSGSIRGVLKIRNIKVK